mmetsp:Transcript_17587/g.36826  ORF Transcript_17587/g.36826 Transcript_17587/m.36826 type:complete len:220 (-) Transcript_17587:1094-1753(-)
MASRPCGRRWPDPAVWVGKTSERERGRPPPCLLPGLEPPCLLPGRTPSSMLPKLASENIPPLEPGREAPCREPTREPPSRDVARDENSDSVPERSVAEPSDVAWERAEPIADPSCEPPVPGRLPELPGRRPESFAEIIRLRLPSAPKKLPPPERPVPGALPRALSGWLPRASLRPVAGVSGPELGQSRAGSSIRAMGADGGAVPWRVDARERAEPDGGT